MKKLVYFEKHHYSFGFKKSQIQIGVPYIKTISFPQAMILCPPSKEQFKISHKFYDLQENPAKLAATA